MKPPVATKIVLALLTLLACLPLGVLYVLADVLYLIIYYVARYRRALVRRNLADCFPDRDEAWRRRVERRFYHNFADQFVETIKLLHISDREISRRITFDGLDYLQECTDSGRDVVLYFAHCFNWEWAPSMTLHMRSQMSGTTANEAAKGDKSEASASSAYSMTETGNHTSDVAFCQVYRPLRSAVADQVMLRIRSRFGSRSFSKASVLRDLILLRREGLRSVTGFMSDQKPSHNDPTVALAFLGRPTAFISGTETLARKLGMAVAYWDMERTGRGHYRLTCRPIEVASDAPFGTITCVYARMLEETILRDPAIWLWTHNRWKNPIPDNAIRPTDNSLI
ncbi:MAG: lysophospholipid acyltransferase family protein [Muribaculaceae bacterium]|nr:lysophospholipid acyltransferase family protein [Muribaculaceae bacterium]